ncbi:hypothetical protein [Pseudomonas sp. PA15(2017)]|uniref:hypothetical protein n=1 Tax=Pseudomonas sp. PA15(2017) TaxID=1932111 RepID=UPI00117B0377|nr:hypothetical protein [Pseudomonas sp. PA15(2017)]
MNHLPSKNPRNRYKRAQRAVNQKLYKRSGRRNIRKHEVIHLYVSGLPMLVGVDFSTLEWRLELSRLPQSLFKVLYLHEEATTRQKQPCADPLWERAIRAKNRGHGALPQVITSPSFNHQSILRE